MSIPSYKEIPKPTRTSLSVGQRVKVCDGSWALMVTSGGLYHASIGSKKAYTDGYTNTVWRVLATNCVLPAEKVEHGAPDEPHDTIIGSEHGVAFTRAAFLEPLGTG